MAHVDVDALLTLNFSFIPSLAEAMHPLFIILLIRAVPAVTSVTVSLLSIMQYFVGSMDARRTVVRLGFQIIFLTLALNKWTAFAAYLWSVMCLKIYPDLKRNMNAFFANSIVTFVSTRVIGDLDQTVCITLIYLRAGHLIYTYYFSRITKGLEDIVLAVTMYRIISIYSRGLDSAVMKIARGSILWLCCKFLRTQ